MTKKTLLSSGKVRTSMLGRSRPWWRNGGLWWGLGLGMALAFVGGRWGDAARSPKPEPKTAATTAPTAISVTAITVTPEAIAQTLTATGTVTAADWVPVSPKMNGLQVETLLVKEGDWVQGGQVLAKLDNRVLLAQLAQSQAAVLQAEGRLAEVRNGSRQEEVLQAQGEVIAAQAARDQAKADLQFAQQDVDRHRQLSQAGAIAQSLFDQVKNQGVRAQANYRQAQARLANAQQRLRQSQQGRPETVVQAQGALAQAQAQMRLLQTQLNQTLVRAPRGGRVVARPGEVGQMSSTGSPLFTLAQEGAWVLALKVPETRLEQVRVGQKVTVAPSGAVAKTWTLTGEVTEILPAVDPESRQGTVKVALPSSELVKSGMFLKGAIALSQGQGIAVPQTAVLPQQNNRGLVYRLDGQNRAQPQVVQLGEVVAGQKVVILSGLRSGDRLVVQGAAYVKPEQVVKVVPPA